MVKKTVKMNSEYLEFEGNDLPDFTGILSKGGCGVGGTTIALTNDVPYVIAAPTKGLAISKSNSEVPGIYKVGDNDVYFLYESFKSELPNLSSFLTSGGKKIVTTYAQLGNLTKLMTKLGIAKDFKLLIDEAHTLTTNAGFMDENATLSKILNLHTNFKNTIFMTATTLPNELIPTEMTKLDLIEVVFDHNKQTKVYLEPTNKPVIYTINNYILPLKRDGFIEYDGHKYTKLYVGVDSVSSMCSLIKGSRIDTTEYRAICTENYKNKSRLKDLNHKVDSLLDPEMTFNFFTKKIFEGVDINSENALMIVVANNKATSTVAINPLTDVIQIAGRIRTKSNPFYNSVVHIFNYVKSGEISFSEYVENYNREYNSLKVITDMLNKFGDSDTVLGTILGEINKTDMLKLLPIGYVDGKYIVKECSLVHKLFKEAVKTSYTDISYLKHLYAYENCNVIEKNFVKVSGKEQRLRRKGFKQLLLEAYTEKAKMDANPEFKSLVADTDKLTNIYHEDPFIADVIYKVSVEKARALNYSKDKLKKYIIMTSAEHTETYKVIKLCKEMLDMNSFNSADKVKSVLKEIYKALNIEKNVTGTTILKYFSNAQPTRKSINNTTVRGFNIFA